MKRFAVVPLLVLAAALPGLGRPTSAQTPASPTPTGTAAPYNGYCLLQPYNVVAPCPTATAAPRAPILPTKTISVSGGTAEPAGMTLYTVDVTSKFVCFTLNEPVNIYALAQNPSAAAFNAVTPFFPAGGSSISIFPDPTTGKAQLNLEVATSLLGSGGLDVKAVWPQEGVEQLQNVIAAAPATAAPATPTSTPTASPTASPTATTTTTGTPGPTSTPPPPTPTPATVATAVPGVPTAFTLRSCVDPNPVTVNGAATLYGQTIPGATCSANVVTPEGIPANFDGSPQVAGSDGLVIYPFTVGASTGTGTGIVQCTYNGQTLQTTTTFMIQPVATPGATATAAPAAANPCLYNPGLPAPGCASAGGAVVGTNCPPPNRTGYTALYADVCVTPASAASGSTFTIFARTVPGASCTPQVMYTNGAQPTSLNTSAQVAGISGVVSFPFVATTTAGGGVATVTCTLGTETAQGSATFAVAT